ncbi:hypothetical protein [Sandarakinorhabdus sp. DWP1-3-1]|uniref:hypothetical protein n=1 Tax=Sandarakinorhabdus sp. DWP1-3-1 TaxID=2804627 RepID=UPI003CF16671
MPGTIELTGQAELPACACCGIPSRRVWGNLIDDEGTTVYVVQWAPGTNGSHAVAIGMVFGPWGEGTDREDRAFAAVEGRLVEDGVQLMVIDAARSPIDAAPLAAKALRRHEIINRPLHDRVFRYVEQIRVRDARVAGLTSA